MKTLVDIRPLQSFSLSVLLASVAALSQAQTPTADGFNPAEGYKRVLDPNAFAVQGDGKVLVGGKFESLTYPYSTTGIQRFNTDGSLDAAFDPRPGYSDSLVKCMAVQSDGKIILGGSFVQLSGQPRSRLARVNVDGTLDPDFTPVASGNVERLALQADGKILVAGQFSSLCGQSRAYVGRLNADGTLDTNFNARADGQVNCMAVQPDGMIIMGGWFGTLGGQTSKYMGRLNSDGTADTAFKSVTYNIVEALALQADGKILVGGWNSLMGDPPWGSLRRLNPDGSVDTGFDPGATGFIYSLAVQVDGRILVGGTFDTLGGQTRKNIARLNADGSLDMTFDPGVEGVLKSLALQADGKILVGGSFSSIAGEARKNIGRLNNTESAVQHLSCDGNQIIWLRGGSCPEVGRTTFEISTNNGADWSPLGFGTRTNGGWHLDGLSAATNANIRARGYLSGGLNNGSTWFVENIAGPLIILNQPVNCTNLAGTAAKFRVVAAGSDPMSYQWFKDAVPLTEGSNYLGTQSSTLTVSNVLGADAGGYSVVISNVFGSVTSLVATLTVTDPIIAGTFTTEYVTAGDTVAFDAKAKGSEPLRYQWLRNGLDLTNITSGVWTLTNAQAMDAGLYTLFVSNQFGTASQSLKRIYVNESTPDTFNPDVGGSVRALAAHADGRILIGGSFTNIAGYERNGIGRVNPDGTLDLSFHPEAAGTVNCLAVQEDGKILVGGGFTNLAGQPLTGIGRLNPDGSLEAGFQPSPNDTVNCFALQPDGKILVGGSFTNIAGYARNRIARLNSDGTLDTSFAATAGGDFDVYSLALQRNGQILVGGGFTNLAGQLRSGIGRLNTDGSLDHTFNPAAEKVLVGLSPDHQEVVYTYLPGCVFSLAVRTDGKILAGGDFILLGRKLGVGLGRLNADGTTDSNFAVNYSTSARGTVRSLALQTDGKVLVAGDFTILGGLAVNYIGRLNVDGGIDTGINPGVNMPVYALAIQADGKILTGGDFNTVSGVERKGLARLSNNVAASQSLSLDGTALFWLRGGSGPQVWRAMFSASTNNGIDWLDLGSGIPVTGGWTRPDVTLPHGSKIRVRGFVTGGGYNGSGWFVETSPANHAPVADIRATKLVVLSTNGIDAQVVLDGSLSSDPDSPLQYTWCRAGNPTPLGQEPITPVTFSAGAHTVTLRVDDGTWNSTCTFTVEVLTAAQPVGRLRPKLNEGHIELNFSALSNHTYTVQVSTNLLDWESIGQAVAQPEMAFKFEDAGSAQLPCRFYRVLAP